MHGTANEVAFLRGLGTYNKNHGLNRQQLLTAYLASMSKRTDWGQIDKAIVGAAIGEMLGEELLAA